MNLRSAGIEKHGRSWCRGGRQEQASVYGADGINQIREVTDAVAQPFQAVGSLVKQGIPLLFDIAETCSLHLASSSVESLGTCVVHAEEAECLGIGIPSAPV